MAKRAVLYARVSGDDRGKDGRNLAGQLEMGRAYAARKGYTVIAELAEDDRGASGAEIDLPQLNAIREKARGSEFDVLIVREIDRLSRNLAKQLIVEEELQRAGVAIEYVLGEYPDTPEGNFMKHVRASVAEFEREKIRERMLRGRALKVRGGSVLVYQRPPYGYRVTQEANGRFTLTVYEAEARIVRLMYQWYARGDKGKPISLRGIAKRLTEMRVPTATDTTPQLHTNKKLGACHWAMPIVRRILGSETYCGIWHFNKTAHGKPAALDQHIAVDVPAIVDRETYELARERFHDNKHNATREGRHEYLLARRLKCSCGYALCGCPGSSRGKVYLYYRCSGNTSRDVVTPCLVGRYRAGPIDALAWDWIKGFITNPAILRESLEGAQTQAEAVIAPMRDELRIIDGLITENEAQARRLLDAYQSGLYTLEDTAGRKRNIDETRQALAVQRDTLAERIAGTVVSSDRIERIMAFADGQKEKVELATRSFETRRALIEGLDVRGVVRRDAEGGAIKLHASCILGEIELGAVNTVTTRGWCPSVRGSTSARCRRQR